MGGIGEGLLIPFLIGEGEGGGGGEGEGGGHLVPGNQRVARNPFTYRAFDLLTWEPLDPLPYYGVKFGRTLNQPGAFNGDLALTDPGVQKLDWRNACRESKAALFVDLVGTLVWGGIVGTGKYTSSKKVREVAAVEFGSYFQRRLQARDYKETWEAGADPMTIAKTVIEDAKTVEAEGPGHIAGGINIVLNPASGSGQSVKVSYPGSSLQTVDSIVSTLSQMGFGVGFDYSYDCNYRSASTTPEVTCNIWYPLKGRTAEETGLVILARDCIDWEYSGDGTSQATEVTETGTTGLEAEIAVSNVPGFPLYQKATSRTQVTTAQQLTEIALGEIALLEYPVPSLTAWLKLSLPNAEGQYTPGELRLGEFDVGDRARFKVSPVGGGLNTDPRFPEGMDYEFRITSWTAMPEDSGTPKVQIDMGAPPLGFVPAPVPPW